MAQNKKGPIAKYSFNNGSDYDEISKRKAKLVGVFYIEDRFGNRKNAVKTSGDASSYINLGTSPVLKQKVGSISIWTLIESKIFYGSGIRVNPIIMTKSIEKHDYCEGYAIYYNYDSERIQGSTARDSLCHAVTMSTDKISRNSWHHYVITYDLNHFSLYIDGALQRRATKDFEIGYYAQDSVLVGRVNHGKNKRFTDGVFDDIAFYDYVLSDKEVMDLYNAPNPNRRSIILGYVLRGLAVVALILLIYFFIRYRLQLTLKKEQQRLELYNIVLETELRVNRALMNPHFVFNSLNALQNFILKNENERANNYLVKFSKLMRRILESNMSDAISLEFEIELLKSYLEIEDLRFEENIQSSISISSDVIPSAVKIPIMMLQPFVENAIWHGLLKKSGEKLLRIAFSRSGEKYILCTIEDNGIGRRKSDTIDLEKSSLATSFIEQRLNLLNRIHHLECSLTFEDKPNAEGTIVKILLPILKK